MWIATPSSQWTSTTYPLPVSWRSHRNTRDSRAALTTRAAQIIVRGFPAGELCYPVRMTTTLTTALLRLFAWSLAAAVTFSTLGPPSYRPHSHLGQDGEHALAFILIGLAFGLAYTRHRLLTSVVAVVLIGLLEILQLWAPGRHARFEDFAVDALTACAGLAVAAVLDRATQRLRWNHSAS
jgi:VanZ family protein